MPESALYLQAQLGGALDTYIRKFVIFAQICALHFSITVGRGYNESARGLAQSKTLARGSEAPQLQ